MKILKSEEIYITRKEPNFDRACDEAQTQAVHVMGIDDSGHSKKIKKWDRSRCSIDVTFKEFKASSGMGGCEYTYIFLAEAVSCEDEEGWEMANEYQT
jgi:hypothetical protein